VLFVNSPALGEYRVVIVGAGLFGATIAERVAKEAGIPVLIIDRRSHVAGNCWSKIDTATEIEYHPYGTHIFHTSNDDVWNYITRFGIFSNYRHRVLTVRRGQVYPMPINLGTICALVGRQLTPAQARELIESEIREENIVNPRNLEEKAISLVGRSLYEAFIEGYTAKQWQTDPRLLPASIITRLPVRLDFNADYFSDKYQGLPRGGYAALVGNMLADKKITIALNTDFRDIARLLSPDQLIVYTGPIDRYFDYRFGLLGWRTLDFEREVVGTDDFQGTAVMNYADADVPFTRIHEFKHLHPERHYATDKTLIAREFSRAAKVGDEPFYPIGTAADQRTFRGYKEAARAVENVIFAGRLGTYKYLDMHQAIGAALKCYQSQISPHLCGDGPLAAKGAEIEGVI
jgi:UDP-galactopyranose mutase